MRSDESRVSKSRASSPDGRGVTLPISEPFPINPQTSASPNAGQPLAMQKHVRQTIITQKHCVQLAFFRNAGLPAELCRLSRILSLLRRSNFPAQAEFKACSLGGEGDFSAVSHPCGFRMRNGERRWAVLSRFENPMIFHFENIKVCHAYFSHSERFRMAHSPRRVADADRPPDAGFAPRHGRRRHGTQNAYIIC